MAEQQKTELRSGYTTGACAAAAAKAAVLGLISEEIPQQIAITLPGGQKPCFPVLEPSLAEASARCAVRKDSGDDPDVTNGVLVYATARRLAEGAFVTGGEGIGRVTKPGLQCAVGEYAINVGPRKLILQSVREACAACGYTGGIAVELSIPAGVELAKRTYNPRLGIVGGISVLGTTGIVEPMSERALIDSIRVELDVLRASGASYVLCAPGNYGEVFARDKLGLDVSRAVLCSNFVGDTLDAAAKDGFRGFLLVGSLGKLVKLAGGIFNTHSHNADCRMELITAHAALAGADRALCAALMQCVTTDDALAQLEHAGLRDAVLAALLERIGYHLSQRAGWVPTAERLQTGAIMFSEKYGPLGQTAGVEPLLRQLRKQEEQR